MTAVAINAISVKEGGSLVVLSRLLQGLREVRPDWHWHVIANVRVADRIQKDAAVSVHCFPEVDNSPWRTRLWYETQLPVFLHRIGADLLFSQTNYLPLRRLPCPSLLLVQHAGHFSLAFQQLIEARLGNPLRRLIWRMKGRWVRASVRRADLVTVQTCALADRVVKETGISHDRVRVVPHGAGLTATQLQPVPPPAPGGGVRIGFITKFGVQKNFAVLFRAVAQLQAAGRQVTLVLTLDEQMTENQEILREAERLGIAGCLENYGELAFEAIEELYRSLHVFVFPSLCESFGFPLVEAMASGLPLLVAEVDSNVEVAGGGGIPFPSYDDACLSSLLTELMENRDLFQLRAQASQLRARDFSWMRAAASTAALMDELLSPVIPGRKETRTVHEC